MTSQLQYMTYTTSAQDIVDHKLPLTSVSGSIYSEYTGGYSMYIKMYVSYTIIHTCTVVIYLGCLRSQNVLRVCKLSWGSMSPSLNKFTHTTISPL